MFLSALNNCTTILKSSYGPMWSYLIKLFMKLILQNVVNIKTFFIFEFGILRATYFYDLLM